MSFGYTCLFVGMFFGLIGLFWHFPSVTQTNGVIVESVPVAGGQMKRLITYEYTVDGVRHRGQRLLGWGRQYPGMLEVGDPFPVYFVTRKPELSYAPGPPRMTTLIVSRIMFTALGITVIVFAWRASHLTNR